jgi:branched-chain amino acid transport system substrate-binding protein
MTLRRTFLAATLLGSAAGLAGAQGKGVSDNELVLGTITDLSGPIANYGKESRNGMNMAVDEINAKGGIHGRKLKLLVEDHGYEPRRAVLAAQKLITQGNVFAILGHLGTATNMAALPFLLENKVFNFMPQGASKELYDPPSPYKVALAPSYASMSASTLDFMMKKKPYQRVGVLYQDDDYGREALEGVEAYLRAKGQKLAEKTSYKRGATDFSSQMARLKAANCDLVFNASTLREFVGSVGESRKIGFNADVLGTAANYSQQVPTLGGAAMEGVYGATFIPLPYADDANPAVREWVASYKKRYSEDPGLYSMYAYYAMSTFAKVAEKAGRNLTPESFNTAMEATKLGPDALGNPGFNVSRDNRLSNQKVRMTQVVGGKWVLASEFLDPVDVAK